MLQPTASTCWLCHGLDPVKQLAAQRTGRAVESLGQPFEWWQERRERNVGAGIAARAWQVAWGECHRREQRAASSMGAASFVVHKAKLSFVLHRFAKELHAV